MNIEKLFIPAKYASLFSKVYIPESTVIDSSGLRVYSINESVLIELFMELGAKYDGKMNEVGSEGFKNESPSIFNVPGAESQSFDGGIPQALVEDMEKNEINVLRAIMLYKNMTLKEVADAYGGKSAAANLANFLARSNEELGKMRRSTVTRIADALGVPPSWILDYLKI